MYLLATYTMYNIIICITVCFLFNTSFFHCVGILLNILYSEHEIFRFHADWWLVGEKCMCVCVCVEGVTES